MFRNLSKSTWKIRSCEHRNIGNIENRNKDYQYRTIRTNIWTHVCKIVAISGNLY